MSIFRTFWQSIKDLFDEMFALMVANMIWLVLSAPLLVVAVVLISSGYNVVGALFMLLAVLPAGPATVGLHLMAQRVTEGRTVSWRLIFGGFGELRTLAWQVYGAWMIGLIIILVNLSFYVGLDNTLGSFLVVLFLYFLVLWFELLMYIGPLIVLQEDRRLRILTRNAMVMAFGRPVFSLVTLLLMALISLLSAWLIFLPVLLTFSFLAIWGFRATLNLIADSEARRQARMEAQAVATAEEEGNARPNMEKGRGGQIRPRD